MYKESITSNQAEKECSSPEYAVAIIGMAGRFPGARNIEEFWDKLFGGTELITFFDDEQLKIAGVDAELLKQSHLVKAAAILNDIDLFDASFFGYTPREAEMMDPQQRLFLECSWEAFENAGYNPEAYTGLIGVFAGTGMNTYLMHLLTAQNNKSAYDGLQLTVGNDKDYLATRVSYKLHLTGPSVCVQTACSTSLVAIHLACQSLLAYECDMALAGGVSVRAPQPLVYRYQEGNILSPDGHCHTFDERARGTIFGNGLGAVVLKRLEDALECGDYIYAVIRGTAINNDGSRKVAYTAPSVDGQAAVIRRALAVADVDPSTISFIETHGTATPLGDAIEVAALKQVFNSKDERPPCLLGAIKTNSGHLDAAAGIAGLIKTALALKHKIIPPNLNFERANPELNLEDSPFRVVTELTPWPSYGFPRRAGISSFGIGGTNAHLIVEEPPEQKSPPSNRPSQLIVLSARSEIGLEEASYNFERYMRTHQDVNLADVAYTLQTGRKPFTHRRAYVCDNAENCLSLLDSDLSERITTGVATTGKQSVVFMFPGQGAQHLDMGRDLYNVEPAFRRHVDECADNLLQHIGRDIRDLLYPETDDTGAASEELNQTVYAQPANFVIEYALAKLWMEWGIQPNAMIGHSIGEYTAACLAGVLSLEDALAVVARRGQLMQEQPVGAMLAVALSQQMLERRLRPELSLAAVNGPELCVVSGAKDAIKKFSAELNDDGVSSRILHTSHAYHSHLMDGAVGPFKQYLQGLKMREPNCPFISNLTGKWIENKQATDPDYWAKHLRATVRFSQGLQEVMKLENPILIEVGPGQTLTKLARQHRSEGYKVKVLPSLPEPGGKEPDNSFIVETLGRLWVEGLEVNWTNFHAEESRLRVPLPTYPFERQSFWFEKPDQAKVEGETQVAAQVRRDLEQWFYAPIWKQSPQVSNLDAIDPEQQIDNCLIFLDECGLGARIALSLRDRGLSVMTVGIGQEFRQVGFKDYLINPRSKQDYEQLFTLIQKEDALPNVIAHTWNVTPDTSDPIDSALIERTIDLGFNSLLLLTQALGSCAPSSRCRIFVISNNLHSVTGDEVVHPAKATVLGPCRVIPQEYQNITCCSIDVLSGHDKDKGIDDIANCLAEEMRRDSSQEVVAYRGTRRWVQVYEPMSIPHLSQIAPAFKESGVYLLTGGLGGLALALAKLIARAKAKIVLLGRTGLPAREEWEDWINNNEQCDPTSEKIRKIKEIEACGAEVMVVSADVTSRDEIKAAVATVKQRFGAINGVLHLAGVPGMGLVQMKSIETTASVLAPKVQGTLVLNEVLNESRLDFLVLFSSITSVTGGLGQVDYCAANAFLDGFALYNSTVQRIPTITVDWDAWEWDSWQDVLMRAMPELHKMLKDRRAEFGIKFDEGYEVLQRLISARIPQVVVSTQDLAMTIANHRKYSQAILSQALHSSRAAESTADQRCNLPPANEIEQVILGIWKEVLGFDDIGVHDSFIDLGGHSLLAVQLTARLRDAFQMELPLRTIFECPTVAQLAEFIKQSSEGAGDIENEMARILEEIEGLSEEEVNNRLAEAMSIRFEAVS